MNIHVKEQLLASGTAANIPESDHLELFLQYDGSNLYFAAGNPLTAVPLTGNGHWSGIIYIGEAKPITLWLVVLTPVEAQQMNREVADQTSGYPALPGNALAQVGFAAS